MRPVRPNPTLISSTTSKMPWRSQSARSFGMKSGGGTMSPAIALHRLDEDAGHFSGGQMVLKR